MAAQEHDPIAAVAAGRPFDEVWQQVTTEQANVPAPEVQEELEEAQPMQEIESLCMNCEKKGMTKILLTMIPHFREVLVMSFRCEHCGFANNTIQSAGSIQQRGARFELRLTQPADLQRQVVKADTGVVKIIELDLEIPAGRGQLTNVEGLISGVLEDLELGLEQRQKDAPEVHAKLVEIIKKGRAMLAGESFPFRVALDDPAGNSWIAPGLQDGVGKWEKKEYLRTPEQNLALGLAESNEEQQASGTDGIIPVNGQGRLDENDNLVPDEIYTFPDQCPGCSHQCTCNMKMVDIPHFKQVIIMATVCDHCGFRSNEVKTGGAIPPLGRKITLQVKGKVDLARDILKSETAHLACPELSLDVNPGTLGGRFTTVEGLLVQVRDDLKSHIFQADGHIANAGDSVTPEEKSNWERFFATVDKAIAGEMEFTVELADPLANSFVQSLADDPGMPDGQMVVEEYTRTDLEEEELGLKDIRVEGYEEDHEREEKETKAAGVSGGVNGDTAAQPDAS